MSEIDLDAAATEAGHGLVEGWIADNERQKKADGRKHKERLLGFRSELDFFTDQRGTAYVCLERSGHFETWPIFSRQFRSWLAYQFFQRFGKAPSSGVLADVLNVFEGLARYEGDVVALHNRVAWLDGSLWYDLADEDWRTVRIGVDGWEIVSDPPPLFRRYSHQQPQCIPEPAGDLHALLRFLNVHSPEDQLLVLVWTVAALVPDIPRPVLVPWGPQGSAKSAMARLLRRLIDPSSVPMPRFPRGDAEFAQTLDHHFAVFFDNVSTIRPHVSDTVCRAVTGDGFTKRKLYSDDDDIIYEFRRVVLLNGINVPAQQPDLLDRCVLIRLEMIPEDQRREEREIDAEFEAIRPQLVGAMFTALSEAMRIEPTLKLTARPRMADWARWGYAIAEVLGLGGETFLNAYRSNRMAQNEEALQSHPVGQAVVAFMSGRDSWIGQPSELLDELNKIAEQERIDTTQKDWPKSATWLSRRLNEVETNLRAAGFTVSRRQDDDRQIVIRRLEGSADSVASAGSGESDATPATDAIPQASEIHERAVWED